MILRQAPLFFIAVHADKCVLLTGVIFMVYHDFIKTFENFLKNDLFAVKLIETA